MEKKNTILLTVIAIATLLVAVVGATFAYFTATVETKGDTNQTSVTTKSVASVTATVGESVTVTNALPGYKTARSVEIKGGGNAGDVGLSTQIVLTPSIADFGSNIKYTVYKKTGVDIPKASGVTCTSTEQTGEEGGAVTHYMTSSCTTDNAVTTGISGTFTNGTPVTIPVTVAFDTKETYYIVVEYENSGNQTAQSGKNFTVDISYKEVA